MRFFLSHSANDHELVKKLVEKACALGIDLYLAEHDVRAGHYLAEKVISEIKRADALVVLLTSAGSDSKYVAHEVGVAKGAGKLVVPIIERGTNPDLAMLQGVEYLPFDSSRADEDLESVVAYLAKRNGLAADAAQREVMFALAALTLLLLFLLTSE